MTIGKQYVNGVKSTVLELDSRETNAFEGCERVEKDTNVGNVEVRAVTYMIEQKGDDIKSLVSGLFEDVLFKLGESTPPRTVVRDIMTELCHILQENLENPAEVFAVAQGIFEEEIESLKNE